MHGRPQQVGDGLLHDLAVAVSPGHLPPVGVQADQLGVVVQHLLEVRHQPRPLDGVTGEAAAQVVVDPPRGHGVEGGGDHVPGAAAQRQLDHGRLRELGRPAKTTPLLVERVPQRLDPFYHQVGGKGRRGRRVGPGHSAHADPRAHGVGQAVGIALDVGAALPPGGVDLGEEVEEDGLGEVGPAEERAAVRCQEHRHRPAAPARLGLHRLHVDGVDVGPLLAVHLDVDEQVVHDLGDGFVLEGFVGHHVAPVARRVTDREEDRAVLLLRPLEGFVAPGEPVHRVGPVLAQVGAGLVRQVIHARQPTVAGLPRARRFTGIASAQGDLRRVDPVTDLPVDASPEDVVEQRTGAVAAPAPVLDVSDPALEANPADVADQLAEVPLDDDDWR